MTETGHSSEWPVNFYKTARRHIPEDGNLNALLHFEGRTNQVI
jgi:hypothetical protein